MSTINTATTRLFDQYQPPKNSKIFADFFCSTISVKRTFHVFRNPNDFVIVLIVIKPKKHL
jgi:hypothetical protein